MSTTTEAASPSDTVIPGSPNATTNAGFSAGASPPLILAFLAVGLFGMSMIGVCGRRRCQLLRVRTHDEDDQPWMPDESFIPRKPAIIGPTPKLWDLGTNFTQDGYRLERSMKNFSNEEHETWDAIMPISVVVTPPYEINSGATPCQPPPQPPTPIRFLRWPRFAESTATADHEVNAAEKGTARAHSEDNNPTYDRRLQVTVAIAMPSQRTHDDTTTETRERNGKEGEKGTVDDDTFEYTLGVHECSWKHDYRLK
ncbi:hypothetical protein H0H92_007342 [Tricholoma furcatifolium]|nr:hypothetical protein H0H92_007342 [Tricholoma furcatifolium]